MANEAKIAQNKKVIDRLRSEADKLEAENKDLGADGGDEQKPAAAPQVASGGEGGEKPPQ